MDEEEEEEEEAGGGATCECECVLGTSFMRGAGFMLHSLSHSLTHSLTYSDGCALDWIGLDYTRTRGRPITSKMAKDERTLYSGNSEYVSECVSA